MVTVAERFAERFNKALDEAGVPTKRRQYLVGKMFKVTSTMGWKWIKGQSMPGYERLPVIAKKLGKEICYFFKDESPSNIVQFPHTIKLDLDEKLLGLYLDKIEKIFPEYGLSNLSAFQKASIAKIGYDSRLDSDIPDEETVTAEVIQWAQAYRASGGS